jgi:hypothetical protein
MFINNLTRGGAECILLRFPLFSDTSREGRIVNVKFPSNISYGETPNYLLSFTSLADRSTTSRVAVPISVLCL